MEEAWPTEYPQAREDRLLRTMRRHAKRDTVTFEVDLAATSLVTHHPPTEVAIHMNSEITSISGFATLTVLSRSGIFKLSMRDENLRLVRDGTKFCMADNMDPCSNPAERLLWTFNSSAEARFIRNAVGTVVYHGNAASFI